MYLGHHLFILVCTRIFISFCGFNATLLWFFFFCKNWLLGLSQVGSCVFLTWPLSFFKKFMYWFCLTDEETGPQTSVVLFWNSHDGIMSSRARPGQGVLGTLLLFLAYSDLHSASLAVSISILYTHIHWNSHFVHT